MLAPSRRARLAGLALLFCVMAMALPASAQGPDPTDVDDFFRMEGLPDDVEEPWRDFLNGWRYFGRWRYILPEIVTLSLAAALALIIAFHPRCQPVREDSESYDSPKAIMIYGVVGAVIAEIVLFNPPMAFVIFGIGGLMRFRSVIGHAKDTGRAIFTAVIGLACGLKFFTLAILGTAFIWVTLWFLEARFLARIELRKLAPETLGSVEASLRAALLERGCTVRSCERNVAKGRLSMLLLIPRAVKPDALSDGLGLPSELANRIEWEWPS